jgi:signal transduction histidine kinase
VVDKVLGKTNEKQQHVLLTARKNVDRIDRVIMNLVDIHKLEAGRMELQKERLDLMAVVRQVLDFFHTAADARHVEFKAMSRHEKVEVFADKQRITGVLKHLVGNAVKFTHEGCIEVIVDKLPGEIKCTVIDTGIGISQENLAKLFGKFQQLDWVPGGGEKGMGLGLAIAKGIVELHGGQISAQSQPGKGSKFIFSLPCAAQ